MSSSSLPPAFIAVSRVVALSGRRQFFKQCCVWGRPARPALPFAIPNAEPISAPARRQAHPDLTGIRLFKHAFCPQNGPMAWERHTPVVGGPMDM